MIYSLKTNDDELDADGDDDDDDTELMKRIQRHSERQGFHTTANGKDERKRREANTTERPQRSVTETTPEWH